MFYMKTLNHCFCNIIRSSDSWLVNRGTSHKLNNLLQFYFPLTSERHGGPCLHVHLNVARLEDFADVIAHRVAAALAAIKTHAPVKHVAAAASVGLGYFLLVQQRVNEQVDWALVFTLHCIGDSWRRKGGMTFKQHNTHKRINVLLLRFHSISDHSLNTFTLPINLFCQTDIISAPVWEPLFVFRVLWMGSLCNWQ